MRMGVVRVDRGYSGLAAINRGESFQNPIYDPMHYITVRTDHPLMTPNALSSSFSDPLSTRMNNRLGNSLVRSSLMFLCLKVVYGDGEVEAVVRGVLGVFVDGRWSLGRRPVDGSVETSNLGSIELNKG